MTESEKNKIELGMLLAALGTELTYNDFAEAKKMLELLVRWNNSTSEDRRAIYHEYRNRGDGRQGLEAS